MAQPMCQIPLTNGIMCSKVVTKAKRTKSDVYVCGGPGIRDAYLSQND